MAVNRKQKVISASEIGNYLYCRRSWWYALQGIEGENQNALAAGKTHHQHMGRRIRMIRLFKKILIVLLVLLVVLLLFVLQKGNFR